MLLSHLRNNMIQTLQLPHSYVRNSGLWVRGLSPILIPEISQPLTQISLVCLPPKQVGGNHKHPRIEVFGLMSGNLELHYLEADNHQICTMATPTSQDMTLYVIPTLLPHAVINRSDGNAYMLEFASEPQHDIESVVLC